MRAKRTIKRPKPGASAPLTEFLFEARNCRGNATNPWLCQKFSSLQNKSNDWRFFWLICFSDPSRHSVTWLPYDELGPDKWTSLFVRAYLFSQEVLTIWMKFWVNQGRIQLERLIPVQYFRKKDTFRGIPFFSLWPEFPEIRVPFVHNYNCQRKYTVSFVFQPEQPVFLRNDKITFPFPFSKYRTFSTIGRNILTENFIQMVSAQAQI